MVPPRWAPAPLGNLAKLRDFAVRQTAAQDRSAITAAQDPLPTYLLLGLTLLVVVLSLLSLIADAAKPVQSARQGAPGRKSMRGRAVILFFRVAVALSIIASMAPGAFIAFEYLRAGPLSTLAVPATNEWMYDVMRLSVNAYSSVHGPFGTDVTVGIGASALNPESNGAERLGWSTVLLVVAVVSVVGAVVGVFAEKLPVTRGIFILMYCQGFVWLLGTLAVAFSSSHLLPIDASPLTNKWLDRVYSTKPTSLNEMRFLRNWVVKATVNQTNGRPLRNTTNLADLPDFRHAFCSQFRAQFPRDSAGTKDSAGQQGNPASAATPSGPVARGLTLPAVVVRQIPSRPTNDLPFARPERRPESALAPVLPAATPPSAAAAPVTPAEAPAAEPVSGRRPPTDPAAADSASVDPAPVNPAPVDSVPADSASASAPQPAPAPADPVTQPGPPGANPGIQPDPIPAPTPPVTWDSSGGPFQNVSVVALDRALVSEVFLVYLVGKPIGTDHYRALAYFAVGAMVGAPAAIGQLIMSVMHIPFLILWAFIFFLFILFASPTPLRPVAAPRERSEVIEFCKESFAIWVMDPVTTRIAIMDVVIFALVFVAIVIRGYAWLRVGEKVQERTEKEDVKLVDYDEVYEKESGALRW